MSRASNSEVIRRDIKAGEIFNSKNCNFVGITRLDDSQCILDGENQFTVFESAARRTNHGSNAL